MFDASQLLNSTISGALSTQAEQCPPGEFPALIQGVDIKDFQYRSGERAGQTGYRLEVQYLILDPQVEASLGRQPLVRSSIMLDVTSNGGLDHGKGKNFRLGALREAVGQNQEGRPWSPKMLEGNSVIVKVKHRMDGDQVFADIERVRKAA